MRMNLRKEPNIKAWFYRSLMGPAGIIDGIVSTLTVGAVLPGLTLATAKRMAAARIQAVLSKVQK